MKLNEIEWAALGALSGSSLRAQVFAIMREAAISINATEVDDPQLLEVIPRLADLVPRRAELTSLQEAYGALARATGLWNYIDKDAADESDRLVAESVTVPELGGITLHREQIAVLNRLLSGENVVLSAPTSFGKSLLIDALLATGKYGRVAIVLPTIALLDEFRRRLRRRFAEHFEIVMHPGDVPTGSKVIFLGTQERLITRSDLGSLDLTVVDEFYKLDPNRKDERSVTLNAAVYRLLQRSKQFFFLGPNIDNVQVSSEGRWSFQFIRTRFSTVAIYTFDLRSIHGKEERLMAEIADERNWPALVFVSSPDRGNKLACEAGNQMAVSDTSSTFADWLRSNVGPGWPLTRAVEFGFAVHHGRLPRAIASHMVRLFNSGDLPVLFCTSTLIEGVNTAAKTVFIYDKKISTQSYDFFTFSNIRGRAGRLGQHHVGQVYLFNAPPEAEATDVSPTLFGDDDNAPDDYVVHLDKDDTSTAIDERVASLEAMLGLDTAGLRLASAVGLPVAIAIKQQISGRPSRIRSLVWTGNPSYEQIKEVVSLICEVRRARDFGAVSASQLTFLISNLRNAKSLRKFLLEFDSNFQGDRIQHDNIFKFLRSCEYGLPQLFAVIELFVKQQFSTVDYSYFLHELGQWFRSEVLRNLDEEGIPIQISERFLRPGDDRAALTSRLIEAVRGRLSELSDFERDWLIAALDLTPDATARMPV